MAYITHLAREPILVQGLVRVFKWDMLVRAFRLSRTIHDQDRTTRERKKVLQYLSTHHSGEKIDLWTHDDESGRQRWVLSQGSNAEWYTICVACSGCCNPFRRCIDVMLCMARLIVPTCNAVPCNPTRKMGSLADLLGENPYQHLQYIYIRPSRFLFAQ